jgi:uncharacterized protein involved in exopolysaccharide biosynthesis
MNQQIAGKLALLKREISKKQLLFSVLFLATSFTVLFVGWNWPKIYTSSSTILVDQQNILQPLMQGTAVTTEVQDRAKLAREIIFGRRAMRDVMIENSWLSESSSELEFEQIRALLKSKTKVENAGRNLIKISFSDENPQTAYLTATKITDVFIDRSLDAKQKESHDAFSFIDGQVQTYHEKLKESERALKEFHAQNLDAKRDPIPAPSFAPTGGQGAEQQRGPDGCHSPGTVQQVRH